MYNIISLGDHCAIPQILQELNIRKGSYPFDWIAHKSLIYDTNLVYNFNLVKELMNNGDVKSIVKKLVGNIFSPDSKTRITENGIWFPHDHGEEKEIIDKYERRFTRMLIDIREKPTIFMMLTRHVIISQTDFDNILRTIISYNPNNKIIFVSGSYYNYLKQPKYVGKVIFKYVKFEVGKMDKDFSHEYIFFRPEIKKFLHNIFSKLGYLPKDIPLENEITKIPNKLRMQFLR
jgi:hypothetical protein